MSVVLGTVTTVLRFPVKSMRGEHLPAGDLGPSGLDGDREWALLDDDDHWASAKADRGRWRLFDGMLDLVTSGAGAAVDVRLPDGRTVRPGTPDADAVLSAHLGRTLHFDRGDAGRRWGRHHDAAPLHLVTTATLAALHSDEDGVPAEREALDPLRLRPNLVVDTGAASTGFAEDAWVGTTLRVGGALLRATETTGRCVMTTRAQADELPRDTTVLKRIGARNGADAGIYLTVLQAGRVAVGDELVVVEPGPGIIGS
ncbi:MOSC domain-containing protein [Patulibacter sp.]|uniref:MOSC domain-containing protein n=1 Tax=Patulibacter sp. TaxID=1912859 RepID=UPI002715918D|nr:MOSC domain-containing protein [Patulibacter sp.]MDO9410305.1 MOSC domain-containing protein [Patulibacter sp.]